MLKSTSSFSKYFTKNIEHFEGTYEELKGLVNNTKGLVVVDFYANWCGPCKSLGREMPVIAEKHPKVTFLKADVDESNDLAEHYGIDIIPQIKFFKSEGENKDIKTLNTIVGADVNAIEATISKYE